MPLVTITRQTLIQSTVYEAGDLVEVEVDRYTALIENGAALPVRRVDIVGIRRLICSALQIVWQRWWPRTEDSRSANDNGER